MMSKKRERILVIKLSALGDFIQALGPMRAIKGHHPDAHITLLTTAGFEKFARECGYFDEIWVDQRPSFLQPFMWFNFARKLNKAGFTRVYDLQNNDRSCFYYQLFWPRKPEWVGTARGASHRNTDPARTAGHALDGHRQTLALAGITDVTIDRLEWMQADMTGLDMPAPYALLVPGCAPQHLYKRWPAEAYGQVAQSLMSRGITPVLIGTEDDRDATARISTMCEGAINLTGQTNLPQIAALARGAQLALGNDTGPMHLIAATGLPCVSLFSGRTHPVKHAPQGDHVVVLQQDDLEDLPVDDVMQALLRFM